MTKDIFSILETTFLRIPLSHPNLTDIDMYLDMFPHDSIREQTSRVPSRFQRYWISACVFGHLNRVKKLRRLIKKNTPLEQLTEIHVTAQLWLGHAQRLFAVSHFLLTHFERKDINQFVISPNDLKMGDIVLSYKTNHYLKHSPLSKFIKYMTHSSITHVMIACHEPEKPAKLLMSDDTTLGLGLLDVVTDPGELFLVLEPLPHPNLTEVHSGIRKFRNIAYHKTHNPSLQKLYRFSGIKCEIACVIGFLYISADMLLRRPISIKNPLEKRSGLFCSELIDKLFKDAGIHLTPRSEHSAIIGPIEFLYSPLLRPKGVIGDTDTLLHAELEVEKQFGVAEKFHTKEHIQALED